MLVVGLTGGIGAGKTTVSDIFTEFGVPVIDADKISREITERDHSILEQITNHFGLAILSEDGKLNRKKLREIIFANQEERKWLENLLHPIIINTIQERIETSSAPYVIVVIPLLFETESFSFIDRILVVDTSEAKQIERVKIRDQAHEFLIEEVLKSQTSRENRRKGADDVIVNDGEIADLVHKVESLHKMYLSLAKDR